MTTPDPHIPDPNTADSNIAEPDSADPDSADPNSVDPDSADPNSVDPDSADRNTVDPDTADRNTVEPNSADRNTPVFQAPIFEQPSGPRPLLVVDAANVIGSRPDGWWKDRAGAARRLLTNLATYHQGPGADTDLTVVLEGAARPAGDAVPQTPTFQILQASHSGDDAIVEAVTAALTQTPTREITVVTADRGLRARVEPLGNR